MRRSSFPWDTQRSLELAFYRTYAIPSIAELLDSTGEFTNRPQKRYDDTQILISAFCEHGYDSEFGRRAIRRMNRIHGGFEIANDDFLYVLSTMVFEPIRWNARFGWRPLLEIERAGDVFLLAAGRRADGIRDLPESYADFERFNLEFERARFGYTDAGHRVAAATRDMFLAWFPGLPKRVGRPLVYALLDEPLLDALGFPHAARRFVMWRRRQCEHGRARSARCRLARVRVCGRPSATGATRTASRWRRSGRFRPIRSVNEVY